MTALSSPGKRHFWENFYLRAFVYGLAVSFVIFIPFIISGSGYFLYYGDFNVQQVPFYRMCHDAIRSGSVFWSPTTDLGANFIGSYTFYLLGSPFFWLTLPFPSAAVPYMMGPLLILKFGCASLTGFIYLKRYTKTPNGALIGGLLYAFSGFSIYNIFFNHFHEAIVVFPLVMAALDSFMYERRRGLFAFTVFLSATMNYYFFIGQVVFIVVYWAVKMLTREWKFRIVDFLWLLFESFLGVVMSCILLVPSFFAVIQNNRVDNSLKGWDLLLYGNGQRYVHIIQAFLFPPDIPARPNFTPDSNAKWASLGAWLPLFSMTGVIAFMQRREKHWLKIMLPLLFLFAFVPILNSAFQLFNASYYARWYYMLTLMMSLATVCSLDLEEVNWRRAIIWTGIATLGLALPIGLIPQTVVSSGEETSRIGLENYPERFWASVGISVLCLAGLSVILYCCRKHRKAMFRILTGSVAVVAMGTGIFVIAQGKSHSDPVHEKIIPYALNKGADLDLPGDLMSVRSDFYEDMDNQGMYWQIPNIQAFHSIVPGSVMEFYPTVGVKRDVGSRPEPEYYALRGFLSVRWLFDDPNDADSFITNDEPAMPGFTYYATQNGYDIYENEAYIPMGYSYDCYFTRGEYDRALESTRSLMLLKGVVLEEEDVSKLRGLLKSYTEEEETVFSEKEYLSDCRDRASMACSSFAYDSRGFTAEFTSEKERIVFFSVPYEKGWSAQVNGEKAEILKVNVGFMAVVVPEGTSVIRFNYMTPGLKIGLLMTGAGILIFAGYCIGFHVIRRRRRNGQISGAEGPGRKHVARRGK